MGKRLERADRLILRRRSGAPTWAGLFWRALTFVGLISFIILVHWLEGDGLKDQLDGEVSFLDAIYFTMISATTTGYGDIVPVTDATRMFDALVVTPIRIFLLLIFVGSAYMFVARKSWEGFLMRRIQRNLDGHTVVAGFGAKNLRAVEELIERGTGPAEIVVIDTDPSRLEMAERLGCPVAEADATRDGTLRAVHVERAKLLIVSAGRDDTSVLICLTARHLAPNLRISVLIREEDNELLARQAGADIVINPVSFAGLLLASSHHGEHISDYLADLASTSGRVNLVERVVQQQEVGRSLKDLTGGVGLRVVRNGTAYGFWEPEAERLEPSDFVIEIRPTADRAVG